MLAADFIERAFARHYAKLAEAPADASQREWMVGFLAGGLRRPLYFPTPHSLLTFLRDNTPNFVYHSIGEQLEMAGGSRANAGRALVLIDVDCKPGPRRSLATPKASGHGYANLNEAVSAAKAQVAQVAQVLERELGCDRHEMQLSFSGSKGYHIRLDEPQWLTMDKAARIELGTFLTGSAARLGRMWPGPGGRISFPSEAPIGGLPRRLHIATRMMQLRMGANDAGALQILKDINHSKYPDEAIQRGFGDLDELLNHDEMGAIAMQLVREHSMPRVDLGVIQNLNGMVRMLGSINGKTGLVCQRVRWDDLDGFDPFLDANPHPRSADLAVRGLADRSLQAGGEHFAVQRGQATHLPTHIAMVFLCSGSACLTG